MSQCDDFGIFIFHSHADVAEARRLVDYIFYNCDLYIDKHFPVK